MKKYILQLVLSIMTITAFISCNDVLDHQTSNRICEVRVSLADQKTRVGLVPSGQWGDMIAKWQDGDKLHIILTKGESVFDLGNIPVREISEDGKNGVFQYALPEELENADYYILSCFTSNCEPKIADGDILYQASIIREPINDYKARVMFSQMVTGDNPFGVFNHYGTYELLHITNKSDKSISFSLNGFNAETRWYKETGAIRLHDKSFITDLSFKKSDKSPSIKIPANSSDIIVSWYIPNGQTIKDAGLVAEIDGKNVKSSNTISSEVTLCTGIAYHMYATWDGKELKFGKGDVTTPSIIKVEPTEIDFGEVKFGGSKTEYFTVSNIGKSKLTFSVSETHGTFDIPESGKEFTLEAGKSKKFSVKFSASGDNIKEGTTVSTGSAVRIFSDAENGTQYLELIGRITKSSSEEPNIKTFTVNGVSFKMVKVEGGTFMMGASDDDPMARDDEKPQHQVTLDGFFIGQVEVTQGLWEAVMGECDFVYRGANLPASELNERLTLDFIYSLKKKTGLPFRLPTEAEWEFAARGGNYSHGYKYSGGDDVDAVAWYPKESYLRNQPVAQKQPNELGIYDMSGNVWEICADRYSIDFYSYSPTKNPCNTKGDGYVLRGGSIWAFGWSGSDQCRVTQRRNYNRYGEAVYELGLRLALSENEGASSVPAEAIDLGLPSGTLWASCNVGASKPEEFGGYYAWGETEEKNEYSAKTYKYCNGTEETCHDLGESICGTKYDVAYVKWGGNWQMPSHDQFEELKKNCTSQITTLNGVKGIKFTGSNGNSIFLPAAGERYENNIEGQNDYGDYFSGTQYSNKAHAYGFYFGYDGWGYEKRWNGHSVRPVYKR